jgi:RNA polymerase sigma-70 factor (ECF subfamily)
MKIIITESQRRVLAEGLDFAEVYKDSYRPIFSQVCMKYAKGDTDLAKEYCQIGFLKVYQNLDKYSGQGNLQGWVRRVVTNEIINQFRKKELDTTTDMDLSRMDVEVEPTETDFMGGRITKEQLRKAIDSLPEGYKTILMLYYFGNLKHNEIAEVLGIDPGTSRSQLSKAKTSMKKSLEKYL